MLDHSIQTSTIFKNLKSSENGLSSSQVQINKEKFGENKLDKKKSDGFLKRLLLQFKNLMIIVLIISAIISTIIAICKKEYGDLFEGGLIFVIVIVNAIIGAIQEKKAEDSIALLMKKTEPLAKVIRDGKLIKIPTEEVVVGDVLSLKAGDSISADARLFETNNFKCDESTLTGESHASLKNANVVLKENTQLAEQVNMCFAGTNATYGNAKAIVTSVGKQTEMGKIAKMLSSSVKEKTPLEKNIDKIGKLLTYAILAIVVVVFLVEIIFSKNISFLEAFLISVALAVAAIPESLPAVITIVMTLGVVRLAKQKAIVKTLSSVETLGCCNVICTDKTGTLTQNKMTIKHIFTNRKIFDSFKETNENLETLYTAISLCNNAEISENKTFLGDATETSMLLHLSSFAPLHLENRKKFERKKEFPFDSERKIMSTINNTGSNYKMFSKGALDFLLPKCTKILIDGKEEPLSEAHKTQILKAVATLAEKAERVLAVATKTVLENEIETTKEDDLIFVGLVGIIDPPREEAKAAIKQCFKAGLKPIMITGDHPDTAFAIAKELRIAKNKNQVMTGAQLDKLSISELAKIIDNFSVFARVSPEHKSKIVKAFKKQGHVVAMTGDGVNDAPSIAEANIGICMGQTGTDVTKSVSDLVITDDNYSTIIVAIKQGRTIYSNIQKIILFLLSTNAVEVLGIFISTIVLRDCIFLLPSQILFINLVTDSFPAFALGLEKPEKNIMDLPPRSSKDNLFSGKIGTSILYQSVVQTFIVLIVFVFSVHSFGNKTASTMVFIIICLMQIIHSINCKTTESIFTINIFNNRSFNISFIGLLALILTVAFVPFLQTAFGIVPLSLYQWIIVILASLSIIPLVEICKFFVNRYYLKHEKHEEKTTSIKALKQKIGAKK